MNRMIAVAILALLSRTLLLASGEVLAEAGEQPTAAAEPLGKARSLSLVAKYAEAEEVLRKSAAEQKTLPPPSADYAATLHQLGVVYTAVADYAQADDCLREAAAIFKQLRGESVRYADTLTDWAKASQLRADYTTSESLIEQSFAVLTKHRLEKSSGYAKALVVLGDLDWARGRLLEARDKDYPRAVELFTATASSESPECATAQNNLGLLYRSVDAEKAEKLIRAAMATRRRLFGEHHPDYANSLNCLALVLQAQGKSSEAEPLLKQALEIRKQTLGEVHPEYATTLNSLASFYREGGDYLRAEPEARRAAEICERALGTKHPYYASALNNLARVYRDEANYVDAEAAFLKAKSIYDAALDRGHPYRITLLDNLAELYAAEGDHQRAKRLFDEEGNVRRASAASDPRGYASWLVGRARLLHNERKFDGAKLLLQQTLDWLKRIGGPELDRAMVLEELALLNLATARLAKDQATKNNGFRSADTQLKQVLEIRSRLLGNQHPDYATALERQASLYRALNYLAAAEARYQVIIELRKKALGSQHPDCAEALAALAAVRREQGNLPAAAADYKQALTIVRKHLSATAMVQTEQQQLAMLHTARSYLDEYLSLMIELAAPSEELYAEVLAWKGEVSKRQQVMRDLRRTLEDNMPGIAELYQEWESAARQLAQRSHAEPQTGGEAAHGHELDKLSEEVEQLERDLAAKSADFRREVELRSRTDADIRAALSAEVVLVDLLEYWHFPNVGASDKAMSPVRQLIAFVVRGQGPTELIDLGPATTIEDAVKDWLAALERPAKDDPGSRLRRLLWVPLERHVSGAETVLISPDGAAGWIPWGALPANEPGKFLIESQSFVMLPVPQLLPDMVSEAASSDDPPTLLVMGDIDYGASPGTAAVRSLKRSAARGPGDRYEWRRLAATKAEIAQVADSFARAYPDAQQVSTLSGPHATEQAIRVSAPRHRFVHLATHGFFAPPQVLSAARGLSSAGLAPGERAARREIAGFHPGLLSGIVLAGANHPEKLDEDDGVLTALEIEQLALSDVDLVTLSACQTGLGSTVSGEGLLGLQRACQVAGASSVLASLWRVDDAQTARLMAAFYTNLWERKLSRAEALRQAQIDMLHRKPLPGSPRGMEFSPKPGKDQRGMEFSTKPGKNQRIAPFYWAAFVLSGDWR